MTKPIIKWSGRKSYLTEYIDEYLIRLDKKKFNYHEPFMGSGAVFFHLATQGNVKSSYLNDILTELIIMHETIMNSNLKSLTESISNEIQHYSEHQNGRKRSYKSKTLIFKHWKDEFNNLINPYSINTLGRNKKIRLTVLFILLNYSCFNGVYRKNPSGLFNVPHGRTASKNGIKDNNISVPDISTFKEAKRLFKDTDVTFSSTNFIQALRNVKRGDVVYVDPPYFDSVNYYNEIDFTHENQRELKNEMVRLAELGAHIMMSNSKSKECKDLFDSPHFEIKEIPVTRTIQRKKNANHQYKEDKKELFITSCL